MTRPRSHSRVIGVTALLAAAAIAGGQSGGGQSIINTPHNLSASGPGAIRATSEDEVCIFCHAPHNASRIQPLWNRSSPSSIYTVYRSDSLKSEPGQPTGASKMCLSCHDGTIALGSVVSRDQIIHMAGGITTLPPGRSNLGTDLSDDHPVSFRYDSALAAKNPKLVHPSALPAALRLDASGELQCTTCHDPHNNMHGSFLTMSNENSAMCRSCHVMSGGRAQRMAGSGSRISDHDDCASCHTPHTAPSGPHLLIGDRVSATCLSCHDGSRAGTSNIAADLRKISTHQVTSPPALMRSISSFTPHATCADCHEPHTMSSGSALARSGEVSPRMGAVRGVNAAGVPITTATWEYEVCFRCHGDQNVIDAPSIQRQAVETNMRLMFSTSALSAHPIQAGGSRTTASPSLKSPWTSGSILACTDCHGSDTSRKAGGTGPDGLHGSNERPLLLARYETADFTMESPSAYALCYRCHERDGPNGILQDRSFKYHRLHIVDLRTPCSTCHESHGIASTQGSYINHAHLMNFNTSVVSPDPVTGRLEFRKEGTFAGSCYLSCHGVNHSPKRY